VAQISLHDYLQQIDTLLEENRLSEAVAHCRHILKKFPRHVDTYRLYGKALLEQQKFDDAVDIFQRVLSADPEDFISHVGLAITHKEKGEVPEAIWHFERAFEMDPYNAAIQDELGVLYAHRDGQRPERINLTRGALARLYFRGHLYSQAAAELRSLLSQKGEAQNGERLDLQTLLAETSDPRGPLLPVPRTRPRRAQGRPAPRPAAERVRGPRRRSAGHRPR
jgi:tetratricopeptide (TPR) repeat protein